MQSLEKTSTVSTPQNLDSVHRTAPSASLVVSGLFFLFVLFPFSQLISLPSYNQPYAVLMAVVILLGKPGIFRMLPQVDRIMLIYLAALGVLLFLATATQGLQFREFSYLISYITPVLTTVVCYWVMRRYRRMAVRLLTISICIWAAVGFIQLMGFPNFLTSFAAHSDNLGGNILDSGRGSLGLAPEPTHFGFHMLLLGASLYLLRGPLWVVLLAIAALLLLAKSSSALLALALGIVVWACVRPVMRIWIFIGIAGVLLFSAIIPLLFDDSYRITNIILAVYNNGFDIFLLDYSINARLSGLFAAFYYFQHNDFMPLGMGLENWTVARDYMLAQFSWIINLSGSGPASGVGLILLQGGFLGVPVIIYIVHRFIFALGRKFDGLPAAACFFVFLAQFYLAAPTFGLVLAAINLRRQEHSMQANSVASERE